MREANQVFTTGEVATICNVSARTASLWIDSGRLKGYRLPGSADRRVTWPDLLAFLRDHGMPTGSLEHHDQTPEQRLIKATRDLIQWVRLTNSDASVYVQDSIKRAETLMKEIEGM